MRLAPKLEARCLARYSTIQILDAMLCGELGLCCAVAIPVVGGVAREGREGWGYSYPHTHLYFSIKVVVIMAIATEFLRQVG